MLIKNTLPTLGKKCERRERRSRYEGREEQSSRSKTKRAFVVVAVEDIPILSKVASFAGCNWKEGLGRSMVGRGIPLAQAARR
jgi:hypothetical protein